MTGGYPGNIKEDLKTTGQKIAAQAGDVAANIASTLSDQSKLDKLSKATNQINKTLFKNKAGRVNFRTAENAGMRDRDKIVLETRKDVLNKLQSSGKITRADAEEFLNSLYY